MTDLRPVGTFCWCELATRDAGAAKSFYSSLFGWTFEDDAGDFGVYTKVRVDGQEMGGLYAMAGPMFEGVPPHWMYHVRVEDADSVAARSIELGGKTLMGPMDIPNTGRMAILQDPTGARFAIWQGTQHCGTTLPPETLRSKGWVELQTRDAQAASAYYTALFGWSLKADSGEQPYHEFALPGGKQFAGMIQIDERWGEAPSNWMGYVMVDDCQATFAKATSLGAAPYMPPKAIPGVGEFSVVADPQGAVFAFIQMAAGG